MLRDKLGKVPRPAAIAGSPKPVPVKPVAGKPMQPKPEPTSDGRFIREGASASKPNAKPAAKPVSTQVAAAGYVVQLASFSTRARADELARKMGARVMTSADGRLFRVRFGPFVTEAEGQRALADAQKRGYPQARLYRE